MFVCDKCGAGIHEGTKFCSQCGDPVTDDDKVLIVFEKTNIANVEITFGQSSSPNFAKAVEICKNIPSYEISGKGKQIQHKITLPITEVGLLINVYDMVGSWKSSQMLIAGHPATKKDLTYHGVGCYRNRQKAYKPDQFCFGEKEYEANIWGCKKLNMPINQWGGGWIDYGKFNKSGVWLFDKGKIKHELEIALNEYELCPALDKNHVFETLEKLPNSINPKKDSNWKYRTTYEEVNGNFEKVAVGIIPVVKKLNSYVIGSFKPKWEIDQSNTIIEANQNKKSIKPKKKRKVLWWLIGILVLLYFLGKS